MITKKTVDTDKILNKIDKSLKEIKSGIKDSELTNEDISELQGGLNRAKELALTLRKKFQ